MKSSLAISAVTVLSAWCAFAEPTVSDLKVTPIAPWGLVLEYTVSGAVAGDADMPLMVTAASDGKVYTAKSLTGDTAWSNGAHRVAWNMAKDGITATVANGTVSVSYCPRYCVIDLSGGANATNYPVSYLDAEPSGGFNTLEYKTTKLVLKRVAAGAYIMGSDQTNEAHRVTLTKPFYMGLFEMTKKQWSLVKDWTPSESIRNDDVHPCEGVSCRMIRGSSEGAKWPASNAVDASSYLGRLRARTGLVFDLPTEAQWEYVCRAGTTTKYSYGDAANGAYMWYSDNAGSRAHEVGTKLPNPWGFYDLHGNVSEWCLDWSGILAYGKDPKGSSSGSYRVIRDGNWDDSVGYSASSRRNSGDPWYEDYGYSFRLVLNSPISVSGVSWSSLADGSALDAVQMIDYMPADGRHAVVFVDGMPVVDSTAHGSFGWCPQKTGEVTLTHSGWDGAFTATYDVTALGYWTQPAPEPPMAEVSTVAITPATREIPQKGGDAEIATSGSGSWTAAVSDAWITLHATSGAAGDSVAYTVGANIDVEDRVGYVYVAGHTHTVTQKGLGATVDKTNVVVERDGDTGTVTVSPTDTRSSWRARPNCDWISVSPTSGTGPSTVTYRIAPWHDVSTRTGTFTVGGHTVSVFQYGSRMELDRYSAACDYYAHVIPIKVDALAITSWTVTPNVNWISVEDAGNGQGGDTVSVVIAENPGYRARTGTVTIGTETFTVTQEGRTTLSFAISPAQKEVAASGGNALVSVKATPDLPWTATSGASWISVRENFETGAGNGHVVYTVSPQSTLYARTGTVTVTPEPASRMLPATHTVRQAAATAALSATGHAFAAAGETATVEVSVSDIVEWKVENLPDWITLSGSASRVGPGTVTLAAAANEAVDAREATVKIAEKAFRVSQKAHGVEVEYDNRLFGADGGDGSIAVHPDGDIAWTAVASASWIVIFQNESGTGDAEILYFVEPCMDDGSSRTGTITVGDKTVYITQRAYDLDITPTGDWVTGNAGAGEIGVLASVGDVWSVVVTEPWISIVTGDDTGTGSGMVRFAYTDNDTGKTRTGKILVAGEVYTLTQAAHADPSSAAFTQVDSLSDGVRLQWKNLAWATGYEIYRAPTNAFPSEALVALEADGSCVYLDKTGEIGKTYFYWIKAIGSSGVSQSETAVTGRKRMRETVFSSIAYANLKGAANPNPATYEEGKGLALVAPGAVAGYAFTGWTPAAITADMTGAQTVTANWRRIWPSVIGDESAEVTGDAETGFVVRPSAGTAEVAVEIPDGVDEARVRVEVLPTVKTVTPNGAAVRVVRGEADVTDFLDIPAAVNGVIDLDAATVKPEFAKEPLDTAKGAVVDLSSAGSPSLVTAPTRKGLVYRLKEGETLEAMEANTTGDSTIGDGEPWTPELKVKGGASGFYTIRVSK